MTRPRTASGVGAAAPPEFCHVDSTGAGSAGADSGPRSGLAQGLAVRVPIRTLNPLNHREFWRVRAIRVKAEREAVAWMLKGQPVPDLPVVVTFTREAMRSMDSDGLAASNKGLRDQVAEWLGLDDADPRVSWEYRQAKAKGFNVLIEITGRDHGG